MFRLEALLEEHEDELAELLVRYHGKTIAGRAASSGA